MEFTAIITIAILVVLFVFRKPLKRTARSAEKMADYLNDTVITLSLEAKEENTRRAVEAMKKLQELGGPIDFDSLYEQACGKSVKE